jgi:hypothetical protein
MRQLGLIVVVCFIVAGLGGTSAKAEAALQLQPLQYVETLKKDERKQGFVDIYNPQSRTIDVSLQVQGFRQTDTKGNLAFYDDPQLSRGIELSVSSAQIPAHKTLRLVFIADGTKLPTGDVFAAIFAEAKPDGQVGIGTTVRLGSLLILTNQTPGVRQATVERLDLGWLQIGTGIQGATEIKNTAPLGTASGFFPAVTVSVWPSGGSWQLTGPLIQSGNSRTLLINETTNQFGLYRVRVATDASYREQWVVLVTGYWRWLSVAIMLIGGVAVVLLVRWHRRLKVVRKR